MKSFLWYLFTDTPSICGVALIRPGSSRATFPLGEGSVDAIQLYRVVPPQKAFPWGEGGCEADE